MSCTRRKKCSVNFGMKSKSKFRLKFESRAKKDIVKLDAINKRRIAKKLKFYITQPDPLVFAKQLVNLDGTWRWRIGSYRVVFDVNDYIIKVLRVQHRSEIYKKK